MRIKCHSFSLNFLETKTDDYRASGLRVRGREREQQRNPLSCPHSIVPPALASITLSKRVIGKFLLPKNGTLYSPHEIIYSYCLFSVGRIRGKRAFRPKGRFVNGEMICKFKLALAIRNEREAVERRDGKKTHPNRKSA